MSIANGKYSLQTIILRDTYKQLNNLSQLGNDDNSTSDTTLGLISGAKIIYNEYHTNSKNELVKVAKKHAISGEAYYDPTDMLESMRPFYYPTPLVYLALCDLITRNITCLGRQTDKTYQCPKVQVCVGTEIVNVPVIPEEHYYLVYQIIAEYSNRWL